MKTKTMQDIQHSLAALLVYVEAVHGFTNAISTNLEISQTVGGCSKALFRMQIQGLKYLELLENGIVVDAGSVLPAGTYRIGPNTIKESYGTLHAAGSLYFVSDDFSECITQIEIVACAGRANNITKESPAYKRFLQMYADAETDRLQKMIQ